MTQMNLEVKRTVRLKGIASKQYEHPDDYRLLSAARALPALDIIVKKISEHSFERSQYMFNTANAIRVTPRQHPRLYRLYKEVVVALDVAEPELFISGNRTINAFAVGSNEPFIVVNAGLLEILEDDEIKFVLAHELGHIKSGHVLYQTVLSLASSGATSALGLIPGIGVAVERALKTGVVLALQKWSRAAEFTADRAAALATQDPSLSLRVTMKLGGAYPNDNDFSTEEFLRQADRYSEISDTFFGIISSLINQDYLSSHPYPVIRAKALKNWHESEEFDTLRSRYATEAEPIPECPQCQAYVLLGETECRRCHTALIWPEWQQPKFRQSCPQCHYPHSGQHRYCVNCGGQLDMYQRQSLKDLGDIGALPFRNPHFHQNYSPVSSHITGRLGDLANRYLSEEEDIRYEMKLSSHTSLVLGSKSLNVFSLQREDSEHTAVPLSSVTSIRVSSRDNKRVLDINDGKYAFALSEDNLEEVQWFTENYEALIERRAFEILELSGINDTWFGISLQLKRFKSRFADLDFLPTKSTLPGAVGQQITSILHQEELIAYELLSDVGAGVCLTNSNLIISKAGMLAEGSKATKIQVIPIADIDSINLSGESQKFLVVHRRSRPFAEKANERETAYGLDAIPVSRQNLEEGKWLMGNWKLLLSSKTAGKNESDGDRGPLQSSSNESRDLISKIKELASLKESGLISEDEFQAAKDKLLA